MTRSREEELITEAREMAKSIEDWGTRGLGNGTAIYSDSEIVEMLQKLATIIEAEIAIKAARSVS